MTRKKIRIGGPRPGSESAPMPYTLSGHARRVQRVTASMVASARAQVVIADQLGNPVTPPSARLLARCRPPRPCLLRVSALQCAAVTKQRSRFQTFSDADWSWIEPLLPLNEGRKGRPCGGNRRVVEGIAYRYQPGFRGVFSRAGCAALGRRSGVSSPLCR